MKQEKKQEKSLLDVTKNEPQEFEVRVEKVRKLRDLSIEPWPPAKEVTATCAQVQAEFIQAELAQGQRQLYALAGRIMAIRFHGKTAFADLQDSSGRLQIYIRQDTIEQEKFTLFKDFIDIGDIIWCYGASFKTKAGEVTLSIEQFVLQSKCLEPLPEKFHGLTDIEIKYRQRYLDLIMNPETRERFKKRTALIRFIRYYLDTQGYLEVETPMLHPIAGGAAARPFITHHNTLNSDFYLRIAPELYLKRLIIGGFERVYEINRNFRNEGISTRHNPEFTMLEFYTAHKDYHFSMDFTENLLKQAAVTVIGTCELPFGEYVINLSQPFDRITLKEAVIKYGNITEHELELYTIDSTLKKYTITMHTQASHAEKLYMLFEKLVEHKLIQPTFIIGFPKEISPLAKQDPANQALASRFELFIAGMEFANSYNELNDPFEQAERFKEQLVAYGAGNEEAHQYDADYIKALEYGLAPTVGVGIGIDRLAMLLTNTPTIKEVILFPTLRKKVE